MECAPVPDGIRAEELAVICGVALRTARRWKALRQMPAGYALGLALLRDGDLGLLSKAWDGWKLTQDALYTPDNWEFKPGEIMAMPFKYALLSDLQRQLAQPRQFELLPA